MWKLISNLILRNRITIICVLVVITIFLGYNATKVQLQYEFNKLLPSNDPTFLAYEDFKGNFGHDGMNKHAKGDDMFDIEKFPEAKYQGVLIDFQDGAPTKVEGKLTLHGITKEVDLDIKTFKCKIHPFKFKEVCGADIHGNIMRDDFDISYGKMLGFKMDVALRIGVEAIKK